LYAQKLMDEGLVSAEEADAMITEYRSALDAGENVAPDVLVGVKTAPELVVDWDQYLNTTDWRAPYNSKVPVDSIKARYVCA
jgi:2-oxoglutarate dehydrogenase E1 component